MKNSQAAFEFTILVGFLFLVFIGLFFVFSTRLGEVKTEGDHGLIDTMQQNILNEINIAKNSVDGYKKEFFIMPTIMGEDYKIEVQDNTLLVIEYNKRAYVKILPPKVIGVLHQGDNIITKTGDFVYLN